MVTYDNPASAAAKVSYIQTRRLGGAMWWESSGDRVGEGSIINLVSLKTFAIGVIRIEANGV